MWLSLFCLVLVGAIAFFQSIHGLFSAVIFFVCTILSAALAFALYEWVAYSFLIDWKPDFALGIALAGIFGITLIILRATMDQLVRRAGLLPALVDKAGGAFFGLLIALVIVGMTATSVQMIPFSGGILGYSQFEMPDLEAEGNSAADEEMENAKAAVAGMGNRIWLKPDRFAVGLAAMMSDGVFSGQRSFIADHPDLITEIGWARCISGDSRHLAGPDSVRAEGPTRTDYVYKKKAPTRGSPQTEYEPVDPKPGHQFWVVKLTPGAEAQDSDGKHRFTMPQIRLVGLDGDVPAQFIPSALRDEDDPQKHVRETTKGRDQSSPILDLWQPGEDGSIEVIFEVPSSFDPEYVAYKTGARAEMKRPPRDELHIPGSGDSAADAADREADVRTASAESDRNKRGSRRDRSKKRSNDRVSGARSREGESFFSDQAPITLTSYEGRDIEVGRRNEALESGHASAVVELQGKDDDDTHISRFKVPEDKALLHLSVNHLVAKSTLGRAKSFAVKTIRNYLVTDDRGQKYEMVGQYVTAYVDGDTVFEVQYFPEQIGSIGRGVGKFREVKERHLEQKDTELYYLFLIDKGRTIVEFSTGRQQVDLKDEDLVAE